jgi:hypothetical protein
VAAEAAAAEAGTHSRHTARMLALHCNKMQHLAGAKLSLAAGSDECSEWDGLGMYSPGDVCDS